MQSSTSFDRRSFLKSAAVLSAATLGAGSIAQAEEAAAADGPVRPMIEGMSLEELNAFRHEYVDSQTEYVCEDGTVIPEVYVKVRALYNTYSFGLGSKTHDRCFDEFIYLYSEDEAQAYLEMPFGVRFTASEFAAESGRTEAECAEICEALSSRGALGRGLRGGLPYYWHQAQAYGMWEYHICTDQSFDYIQSLDNSWGPDTPFNKMGTETPFYRSIPAGIEIVADDSVHPFDDYLAIVERNTVFGVCPCQCQLYFGTLGQLEKPEAYDEVLLDRCLVFGENAEYCIANGGARQITKEECLEILQRTKDEGMVFQTVWTKNPEVICNCHRDICGILNTYRAFGDDMLDFNTNVNFSRYEFQYDKDACIKCGLCMQRCPVECITMDEDGYPTRNAACVRCGQCGLTCPAEARKLTLRDLTDVTPLSDSLLDDYNLKAAYRVNNGLLALGDEK